MEYDLVEIEDLSGNNAHIYSVKLKGDAETLLEKFIKDNKDSHKKDIEYLIRKIIKIGKLGCQDNFFKLNEGIPGDGVCALWHQNIRLYCIRYGHVALVVGYGGEKNVRAYQDDPELNATVKQVINLAADINQKVKEKEITFTDDGEIQINE
jgi:hypothetical protein